MTRFKLLPSDANVDRAETDCPVEIAQWASDYAPCDILIFGDGIPSSRHGDGVLITVRPGEGWENVLKRVHAVRDQYSKVESEAEGET